MIRFFWYFQMTDLIGAALVKRRRPQLVRRPFDSEAVVTAVGEAACVSGYLGQAIYCNRTVGLPTVAISTRRTPRPARRPVPTLSLPYDHDLHQDLPERPQPGARDLQDQGNDGRTRMSSSRTPEIDQNQVGGSNQDD